MDSLTPLISTGVSRNHLLRLCCKGRGEGWPLGGWPGACSVGSTGLWVWILVSGQGSLSLVSLIGWGRCVDIALFTLEFFETPGHMEYSVLVETAWTQVPSST